MLLDVTVMFRFECQACVADFIMRKHVVVAYANANYCISLIITMNRVRPTEKADSCVWAF